MKKVLIGILVFLVLIVMTLMLGRNILARAIVVGGIKQVCGLKIDITKVDIGLPKVSISGLKIYNPAEFKDKLLADIPEISMDFDLPAFFKNKVHLGKLTLDVREMDVILNEQGKLNLNSLALLVPKPGAGKPPEVKIDELYVKIGKVSYKGSFPGVGVKTMEFNPNVDETLHDVTNPSKVASEIMQKILSRIGIGSFSSFAAKGVLEKATEELNAAAKNAMDNAAKGFQGLFNKK